MENALPDAAVAMREPSPERSDQRSDQRADQRSERRTNLFVVGAIYEDGETTPTTVRIRDLSPTGALIEGEGLPEAATAVRLTRGSFSVAGELLWSDERRAGLRFASLVDVAEWLPGGAQNRPQQRVDRMMAAARGRLPERAGHSGPLVPTSPDYAAIARLLAAAGEALIADAAIAARHYAALQAIDIAAQALGELGAAQKARGA